MQLIKTTLIYILLFLLLYFEPEQIGPITFSQLWKIPLFVYLVWQVLIVRKIKKPTFIKWSYLRAGKNLMNGGLFINYFAEVVDFIRYMMFPLMFEFVSIKIPNIKRLRFYLVFLAKFFILSSIPFLLNIIQSNGKEIEFGETFNSYVGLFQNPHAAAITTTISIFVIIAFIRNNKLNNSHLFFYRLIVILGVYVLYLTYVRTGYLMLLSGLVIMFFPAKFSIKQIIGSVFVLAALVTTFFYLLETNEIFYNRIFDIRNGQDSAVGSGRLMFWQAAIELWANGNYFQLLFGHGYEGVTNKMFEVTGLRIFAHSEVFTQLGQNGLFGLVFFMGFVIMLYKFIRKHKTCTSYRLAITTLTLYTSFMLTQGGVIFPFDVFMVFILVSLRKEKLSIVGIKPNLKHERT